MWTQHRPTEIVDRCATIHKGIVSIIDASQRRKQKNVYIVVTNPLTGMHTQAGIRKHARSACIFHLAAAISKGAKI